MARNQVRLDHKGIEQILKGSGVQAATRAAADAVADNVKAQGVTVGGWKGGEGEIPLPVEVSMTTTDRAHGRVSLAHPAGQAVQAKRGALTKAAAQAGLDVRGRK